ncbi:fidgetin-like protein 1 [Odontomachus brunneus]|uniref:fidgetin-like protein 1 n=1 Tax=Odontomachus brunneus TaxID=486640 RepID=UPI0013F1E625|nr:fidgetin-like protein 1 [Odontomachus brunneus]XP_032663681.1 fidgetin-like protein 1 [Odontomachus brunneus]XP_032663682.1 fidgetin-like protein 1 [Odontomachus brunneus]
MSFVNENTQGVAQDLKNEKKIEKNNYLAVYHTLKFSKQDKDCFEVADIERRSLAMKYMTAKLYDSDDTAAILLREGLEDYDTLMKDKDGVNNYWKQIKSQLPNLKNDPLKWKSGLNDVDYALNIIKPLTCQESNTLPCKGKSYNDRDIEKLINKSKKDTLSERNRKIPLQMQASTSKLQATPSTSQRKNVSKVLVEPNDEPNTSAYFTNISRSNSSNMRVSCTEQNVPKLQSNTYSRSYQNLNNFVQKRPSKPINNDISDRTKSLHKVPNPRAPKLKPAATIPQFDDEKAEAQENAFGGAFRSARDELYIQEMKNGRGPPKKSLGGRAAVNSQFVCPFKRDKEKSMESYNSRAQNRVNTEEVEDERLRNIDPTMIELIRNEIMDSDKSVTWDDIAGLEYTKKIIKEVVVFPMLRPDIFTGLRRPPKGILLFGPPGTGKTLIGKCIASQSKSTFFSISASSLTSKWIGEGEKMVRALFAVARVHQPSVVFIDEIDSLLTQRSETEHESSRRLKTEFLVQLDGAATSDDDRILIVGATNRPQELDEAARRRLVKRLYVPLPELKAREQIINNLLASVRHNLSSDDVAIIAECSAGYSGADMTNLCKEASMEPIRSIPFSQLEDIRMEEVRHITKRDFEEALNNVRPSVSQSDLNIYIEWDRTYGSGTAQNYKV